MTEAASNVTYKHTNSQEYPHVEWLELNNDGILHECAILKRDEHGNILFFKTNDLDEIDKRRLAGILMDRNARTFELYDLMAQKTLGNGMNALVYFHQLVRQLTPNGKILDPRSGQMGGAVAGQTAPIIEPVAA